MMSNFTQLKKNIFFYTLLFFLSIFIYACSPSGEEEEDETKLIPYKETVIPTDVKDLYKNLLTEGGVGGDVRLQDTLILVVQGGPISKLVDRSDVIETVFGEDGKYEDEFLLNRTNIGLLHVHQAQTLNNLHEMDITIAQGVTEAEKSVKILSTVIADLKKQGKYVVLYGFSYGFFILEHLIATEGVKFDKAFLGGGRFDLTEAVVKSFQDGKPLGFDTDAVTTKLISAEQYENSLGIMRVAAGLAHNRYTDLLKDVTDLYPTKLLFQFGGKDQSVGRLTDKEIQFLKDKKANYILDESVGHEISDSDVKKLLEFLVGK